MDRRKILIVDDLHPLFKAEAEDLGYEVHDNPHFTLDDALPVLNEYVGLAVRSKFLVDRQVIDTATKLKFIARAGAGLDNIDEVYIKEKGIICINAPEGNRDAVGEHALGMLLGLMNNLRKSDIEIRNGIWDREGNRGYELKGKTVGIIGYGFMGKSFAKKLKGFDVNVIAYDKYRSGFSDELVREVSMEEIVKHADVLSLHIPLTRETRKMVNDEYFFHFKKPIFFLNTARGEIAETQAVLNAINQGKILGAGLDVLEVEKMPQMKEEPWFDELTKNPKVILSPHVAGWSFESYRRISQVLAQKLKEI